jgi:hypothetical protein
MTNQSTFQFELSLSVIEDGVGNTDAVLIFEALQHYSEVLLRHLIGLQKEADHKSASVFWAEYQQVTNLQRAMFERVSKLAFANFEAGLAKSIDKEASVATALDEYCNFFQVKR